MKQKTWLTTGHESMGLCPVCDQPITTDQRTTHKLAGRVHLACAEPVGYTAS